MTASQSGPSYLKSTKALPKSYGDPSLNHQANLNQPSVLVISPYLDSSHLCIIIYHLFTSHAGCTIVQFLVALADSCTAFLLCGDLRILIIDISNEVNLLCFPDTKIQILQSFSAISNTMKLMNMTSTPKGMECLNGIRVLSISWVILGHIYPFLHFFTSKCTILQSSDFCSCHSSFSR